MIRVPTHREPTHPGEMLQEEFLKPMGLSQRELADGICVPYQRVNEIVNRRRGLTPATALRLAKFFGNTPGFWMNLQLRWDLYHAQRSEAEALEDIQVHPVAPQDLEQPQRPGTALGTDSPDPRPLPRVLAGGTGRNPSAVPGREQSATSHTTRWDGPYAAEAGAELQKLRLALKRLLPNSTGVMAELSGLTPNLIHRALSGHANLTTEITARLLAASGTDTAALIHFAWTEQPPSLPEKLRAGWQPAPPTDIEQAALADDRRVRNAFRSLLRDRKIAQSKVPYQIGWENSPRSNRLTRYLTTRVPAPWGRLLQVLQLAEIDPEAFCRTYLLESVEDASTKTAG